MVLLMEVIMLYRTQGTCSTRISVDLDQDHIIKDVAFTGGCDGNLQGICRLTKGKKAEEVIGMLEGIRCGYKNTSCPDQLAKALRQAIAESDAQ
jgi:uncharacterized protein (TIGR03905 family)